MNPGEAENGAGTLNDLTPEQQKAVTYTGGPAMIVAGPGSGKTLTMATRVAWLIKEAEIAPWRIMAVTFTNKAASELRSRCEKVTEKAAMSQISTFHSFCAKLLRADAPSAGLDTGFSIYDRADQERVVKLAIRDVNVDDAKFKPSSVLSMISRWKNSMLTPIAASTSAETYPEEVATRIYERYEEMLSRANAVDFDDLLVKSCLLLDDDADVCKKWQARFQHVLVDEFQDTNAIQFRLISVIAEPECNLWVVGDPDQSIYSWRHADPGNIEKFFKSYADTPVVTLPLSQSFRPTKRIIEAANAVISSSRNSYRRQGEMWTENDEGRLISVTEAYTDEDEATLIAMEIEHLRNSMSIPLSEIAVLYRTNEQSRAFEHALGRVGVPYRLIGSVGFYEREEIKDLLSYVRAIINPNDDAAVERIINKPARAIGGRTLSAIRSVATREGAPLLTTVFSSTNPEDPMQLKLSARALTAVRRFANLMKHFMEVSETVHPHEIIETIINQIDYMSFIEADSERAEERKGNIRELISWAQGYAGGQPREGLATMMQEVALVAKADTLFGNREAAQSGEFVTLTTLHQAKGTEYDVIFMVGMNEGILPHSRSVDESEDGLDEERRLCYVGITRARKLLYLSYTFMKFRRGLLEPSRFLLDIPADLIGPSLNASLPQLPQLKERTRLRKIIPTREQQQLRRLPNNASHPQDDDERPETKTLPSVSAGDKVRHAQFGDGTVVSITNLPHDSEIVVVFKEHGIKRLLLSLAPLEKR